MVMKKTDIIHRNSLINVQLSDVQGGDSGPLAGTLLIRPDIDQYYFTSS